MRHLLPSWLLSSLFCLISCQANDTKSTDPKPNPKQIENGLALAYSKHFSIGLATRSEFVKGERADLIAKHFNRVTAEYEMKWAPMQKQPERYDFSAADALVDFSLQRGMKVTGHTFLWHIDTPEWVFVDDKGDEVDPELLRKRIDTHIMTVGNHFRGKVDSWDVVNEVLSDTAGQTYRPSLFYEKLGESYIADAFRSAEQADPDAELWYNDYMIESPEKLEKLLTLIRYLKSQKVKLTGIGFQGHYNLYWPPEGMIAEAFDKVIAEGLKIKVSELDITVYSDYPDGVFQPERQKDCDSNILEVQAERYAKLFKLFRSYRQHMSHVTVWGLTDDFSWLNFLVKDRSDCPLLFDKDAQPKPAFFALYPDSSF